MPKPRALTDEQARAAYADYLAAKGARGIRARLCRKYNCSRSAIETALDRGGLHAADLSDSRGTSATPAP